MKCAYCHKAIASDDDNYAHRLFIDLTDEQVPPHLKEIFSQDSDEYGLHEECVQTIVRQEKLEYYQKALEPIFEKLNRNQIRRADVEAIVEAFLSRHRYLQNEAIIIIRSIIELLGTKAENPCYEDGRNLWGLRWCKKVSKEI